ncbi:hypothetical protein Hypma_013711 [Hypsizygus marmoreus]|uniref:Uncharacterized protein n=1 Tax=Hypsizygus marmoreus TaxID=39966 RepID=A0A369JJ45_HYPMA|nr:hypothetical protein Hypma_013711 [Hypsizygus marmoreus]
MSNVEDPAQQVAARTQLFEALLDSILDELLPYSEFIRKLQEAEANLAEADDYVNILNQRLQQHQQSARASQDPSGGDGASPATDNHKREHTPEGLSADETARFRVERDELLGARQQHEEELQEAHGSSDASSSNADALAQLLSVIRPVDNSLPSSVLSAAPHLGDLVSTGVGDSHLEETWKLRHAFGADKAIDPLINLVQVQPVAEPIPHSIWRSIIQDL